MSLNGLDSPKVTEAYEATVAESGGWLLLKYISRDEIELHAHGSGGVSEAREAIQAFGVDEPLFGLIRYRRRSILIKYVPEGTSRLAQARATVHFQAISERFYPHDAILPISTAAEVNDTTLSQACQLHTASGSLSSATSSLKRRRLGEITEAAEENSTTPSPDTTPSKRTLTNGQSNEDLEGTIDDGERTARPSIDTQNGFSKRARILGSAASVKDYRMDDYSSRKSDDPRRRSSASTRPSTRDLYESPYTFNGKVKYAPRPSLESGRRPHTSHTNQYEPRPVASLPAGIRRSNRNSSDSRSIHSVRPNAEPTLLEVPEGSSLTVEKDWRPSSRASSFAGVPAIDSTTSPPAAKSRITPEKARLMKALQLRQKQLSAAKNKQGEKIAETVSDREVKKEDDEADSEPSKLNGSASIKPVSTLESDSKLALVVDHSVVNNPQTPHEQDLNEQASESDLSNSLTSHEPEPTLLTPQSSETETISSLPGSKDLPREDTALSLDSIEEQEVIQDDASATLSPDTVYESVVDKAAQHRAKEPAENIEDNFVPKETAKKLSLHSENEAEETQTKKDDLPIKDGKKTDTEPTQDMAQSRTGVDAAAQDPIETRLSQDASPTQLEDEAIEDDEEIPIKLVVEGQDAMAQNKALEAAVVTTPYVTEAETATTSPVINETSVRGTPEIEVSEAPSIASAHASESGNVNDFDAAVTEESHLEELDQAVVEEAKPIVVSRSPKLPPFFADVSKRPEEKNDRVLNKFGQPLRSVSSSSGGAKLTSLDIPVGQRKSSSPSPSELTPPKKVIVSSSLSSRIKAFEMLSSKSSTSSLPPKSPKNPSPLPSPSQAQPVPVPKKGGFFSRGSSDKSNEISKSSRPFSFLRGTHTSAQSAASSQRPKTGSESEKYKDGQEQSSSRPRTEPVAKTSTQAERPPLPAVPAVNEPELKRESVSVIARIVRDDPAAKKTAQEEFREGPIVIERQNTEARPAAAPVVPTEAVTERPDSSISMPPPAKRPESLVTPSVSPKPLTINLPDNLKSHPPSPALPTPATIHSQRSSMSHMKDPTRSSLSMNDSNSSFNGVEDKKESRKSRLLRRMSTISSTSRKSIQHAFGGNSVKEEPSALAETTAPPPPPAEPETLLDGWVNVQLPDTLLWRRRCLKLSSQGYITLSHTQASESSPQVRRYHLSDFKAIVVPDRDMEELPYSVILELEDGGSLQCACQDSAEQSRVLQTLKDCYRTLVANGV